MRIVKIKYKKRLALDKWPYNSTRILIPTVVICGFLRGSMDIMIGFWIWRIEFQVIR